VPGHCVSYYESNPYTDLDRPLGYRRLNLPEFLDICHIKVARLLAISTGHLYPKESFLIVISVRGRVESRVIVGLEGLVQ
jgi:hypothetical protein